ncbi:hypothetical protein cyc_05208 [Cyclospora cayetanensis]|uniref:Uncharacterized protein n=1 Tax=Cyclospora cayetanensis TaxID=88456 RepID=A0A1D3CSM8_9EIME|nr:hypothetical protein cyc_05208 [Cyclospora cayetanensis]
MAYDAILKALNPQATSQQQHAIGTSEASSLTDQAEMWGCEGADSSLGGLCLTTSLPEPLQARERQHQEARSSWSFDGVSLLPSVQRLASYAGIEARVRHARRQQQQPPLLRLQQQTQHARTQTLPRRGSSADNACSSCDTKMLSRLVVEVPAMATTPLWRQEAGSSRYWTDLCERSVQLASPCKNNNSSCTTLREAAKKKATCTSVSRQLRKCAQPPQCNGERMPRQQPLVRLLGALEA